MKRLLRLTLATAAAVGIGLSGVQVAAAGPADPGTATQGPHGKGTALGSSCSGKLVQFGHLKKPYGDKAAHKRLTYALYYSTANGGTNCFKVINTTGKKLRMSAYLSQWNSSRYVYDKGYYSSYAGAAIIKNMKGKCVSYSASVTVGKDIYTASKVKTACG